MSLDWMKKKILTKKKDWMKNSITLKTVTDFRYYIFFKIKKRQMNNI